jgi:hypothetical protein
MIGKWFYIVIFMDIQENKMRFFTDVVIKIMNKKDESEMHNFESYL